MAITTHELNLHDPEVWVSQVKVFVFISWCLPCMVSAACSAVCAEIALTHCLCCCVCKCTLQTLAYCIAFELRVPSISKSSPIFEPVKVTRVFLLVACDLAVISLDVPHSVTIAPSQQAVRLGGSANFVCLKAFRGYEVQWLHNGQPVMQRHNVIFSEGLLTIRHVTQRDAGTYSCVAGEFHGQMLEGPNGEMIPPGMFRGRDWNNYLSQLKTQQIVRPPPPGGAMGGSVARLIIKSESNNFFKLL